MHYYQCSQVAAERCGPGMSVGLLWLWLWLFKRRDIRLSGENSCRASSFFEQQLAKAVGTIDQRTSLQEK